jgi:hypothetical protein
MDTGRIGVWRAWVAISVVLLSITRSVALSKLKRGGGNHYNNLPWLLRYVSEGKNTEARLRECGFWRERTVFRDVMQWRIAERKNSSKKSPS